jgi:large subunit ribosomal protein L22
MEAIAQTKYLKGSPRKARLVIDLIRGRNVAQALAILKFTDKRAAEPIEKCVRSAIANATFHAERQNIAIDPDDLWVKSCFVNMGPTKNRRRVRPAPQGRAFREQRHYCHITIMLTSDKPVEEFRKTDSPVEGENSKKKTAKSRAKSASPKKEMTAKAKTETKKSVENEEKSSKS